MTFLVPLNNETQIFSIELFFGKKKLSNVVNLKNMAHEEIIRLFNSLISAIMIAEF